MHNLAKSDLTDSTEVEGDHGEPGPIMPSKGVDSEVHSLVERLRRQHLEVKILKAPKFNIGKVMEGNEKRQMLVYSVPLVSIGVQLLLLLLQIYTRFWSVN